MTPTLVERIETACERVLFAHRKIWLLLFAALSALLLWQALLLKPEASLKKLVPAHHPFILNYLKFESELRPLGNSIRISVETTQDSIYTREYLELIKKITDEVFNLPV